MSMGIAWPGLDRKSSGEVRHRMDAHGNSKALNSSAAAMKGDEWYGQSLAEKGLEQLGKSRAKTGAAED